jgi:L-ascorbate metabolism protein UlaG (beta-lactamase superfamily)
MLRQLISLSALVLAVPAVSAKEVTIRWHGQSFFEVQSSKGTVVAIDPHNFEAYGRRAVKADAVLITHFHIDHASPAPIVDADKTRLISGLYNKQGFGGNRKNDEFHDVDVKVKDIRVTNVGTYHDNMEGLRRGKNAVFVLEVDGLKIVHLGDLGHSLNKAQLRKIGDNVDVLMVPVGGVYTLNGSEAKEVVAQIKPRRHVIPMHYATDVYRDLLPLDEFLEEQNEKLIKRLPDNELTIDADAVPRKEPLITIIHHRQKQAREPGDKDR